MCVTSMTKLDLNVLFIEKFKLSNSDYKLKQMFI